MAHCGVTETGELARTRMRSYKMILLAGLALIALGLSGCSSGSESGVYHVDLGATQTRIAQNDSGAPVATPTPGPLPTPYLRPTDPPDPASDTVITRVGSETITLDEFRQRVRFERWYPLRALARQAEQRGPERVLDLTRPENASAAALFSTLADSVSFGRQVHRIMVIESVVRQEAARRQLELDPFQFGARLAQYMGVLPGDDGRLPLDFDAQYQQFLAELSAYTGMTEDDLRRIARAQTAYAQLQFLISQDPAAIPDASQAQAGIEVRDAVLSTEARAQEVADRLRVGESLSAIMASLGIEGAGGDTSRIVRRSDLALPPAVLDAIFRAGPDDVIGPLATGQGWYVARVVGERLEALSPREIDAVRRQYFLDWLAARTDDPAYTVDNGNWLGAIPQDPLPRDVSPLLTEAHITRRPTATPMIGN